VKFKALASAHNTFWFRTISALPEVTFNRIGEKMAVLSTLKKCTISAEKKRRKLSSWSRLIFYFCYKFFFLLKKARMVYDFGYLLSSFLWDLSSCSFKCLLRILLQDFHSACLPCCTNLHRHHKEMKTHCALQIVHQGHASLTIYMLLLF
jgi:hypothetical protein